jgi:diguanylate cyclase (GGDEF)-like protein/PAS domain S-box-containing protein
VRGTLFDLVLLPLLTLFFAVLQAKRMERRFRFWLVGWTCFLLSIAMWQLSFAILQSGRIQEAIRLDTLIMAALAFLLSFLPEQTSWKISTLYAALLGIPAFAVAQASLYSYDLNGLWPVALLQVIGLVAASRLRERPRDRLFWFAMGISSLPVTLLLHMGFRGSADASYQCIPLQMFTACTILFFALPSKAQAGRWIGASGFALWAGCYSVLCFFSDHAALIATTWQIWNIPRYLVGFGMILKVMEQDTAALKELSEEYRLLYENNPHPMWIFDAETNRFLSVNDAAIQNYGYSREEFLAMTIFEIRPEEEQRRLAAELQDPQLLNKNVWQHRRKDGSLFQVEITAHHVTFLGKPARFVLTMDITEREELNRSLVHNAQHDPLTGLPNRLLLEDRAQQALLRARREKDLVALFTIDVDHFKQVNDTFGHPVGDEVLVAIAQRLKSRVREADTLARTGGEEFTLIVGGIRSETGARKFASILLDIFLHPIKLPGHEIKTSISIGVALFPEDGDTLEEIRKQSDKALYRAKRLGRNRAVFSSEGLRAEVDETEKIEFFLRQAIHEKSLQVAYQPIFNAARRVCCVEALVRIPPLQLEGIGPTQFIPIAEETGLIVPLGLLVLEKACQQVAEWRSEGTGNVELAVNVSCHQILQPGYAQQVLATLNRFDLSPQTLHLELTETTLLRDFSDIVQGMNLLAASGVRFSIDDFGTGYSSLERLTELPIATVKIDRSFIHKLPGHAGALGIVQAITQIAKHLELDVVAEGVETEDQIELLLDLDRHKLQGFLLSRPLSAAEFTARVASGDLRLAEDPRPLRGEESLSVPNPLL